MNKHDDKWHKKGSGSWELSYNVSKIRNVNKKLYAKIDVDGNTIGVMIGGGTPEMSDENFEWIRQYLESSLDGISDLDSNDPLSHAAVLRRMEEFCRAFAESLEGQ